LKIIIISGSLSHIGKTTVLRSIQAKLEDSSTVAIKIGHRPLNADKPEKFFSNIREALKYIDHLGKSDNPDFLLVESNSILNYIKPDLVIFLKSKDKPEKESAKIAKPKADIIIDENFDCNTAARIITNTIGDQSFADVLWEQYKYIYDIPSSNAREVCKI
jgi:hypothetical protein